MNDLLIKRKRLIDIFNDRCELIKILHNEIAVFEKENKIELKTKGFHSHSQLLSSEVDMQCENVFTKQLDSVLVGSTSSNHVKSNFDFSLPVSSFDMKELSSIERLENLVNFQEKSLSTLLQKHHLYCNNSLSSQKSNIIKIYISASDGGFPILQKDDPSAVIAKKRLHHNCGGPSLLIYVDRKDHHVLSAFVCQDIRSSILVNNDSTQMLIEEIKTFQPDIVLLMPNNTTGYSSEILEELKEKSDVYLVARDGDACSYNQSRVFKNLIIATSVDLFISVDGEFVENANEKGLLNVEYIPSFVNEHETKEEVQQKTIPILFAGTGHLGIRMDNNEFMYQKRRDFIKKVDLIFTNCLQVIGFGWKDLNLSNLRDEFISEELIHQYAMKSKIVIAYDGPFTKGFTSVRTFRTLMSGAFVLIRYFPGIENLFVNGKHLVWFKTDEEGIELIEYYLNNDNERRKIANSGYEYLLSKKGWRRKNIIIDYLINKYEGTKKSFGELYGSYTKHNKKKNINNKTVRQPKHKPNDFKEALIDQLRDHNFEMWRRAYLEGYNSGMGDHRRHSFYNKYIEEIGYYREVSRAKRVVEFAPGNGEFFEKFICTEPQKEFIFIDISESNLEYLKSKFSMFNNITYILNNQREIPIADIDCVFSFLLCQSVPKSLWIEHLVQVYKMLNEGGSYFFQFAYNPNLAANDSVANSISGSQTYTVDQISSLIKKTGFQWVEFTQSINLDGNITVWYLCRAVKLPGKPNADAEKCYLTAKGEHTK